MSETPDAPQLPPLPPDPVPPDLLASCRAGLVTSRVRTVRSRLEVHRTHLRIVTPSVWAISRYARRMDADDLVLAFDEIESLQPIGAWTTIVELPERAALALAGPSVRDTLTAVGDEIPVSPRRFRPFFVGFWLINHRPGRIRDSRPLAW